MKQTILRILLRFALVFVLSRAFSCFPQTLFSAYLLGFWMFCYAFGQFEN